MFRLKTPIFSYRKILALCIFWGPGTDDLFVESVVRMKMNELIQNVSQGPFITDIMFWQKLSGHRPSLLDIESQEGDTITKVKIQPILSIPLELN